MSKVAQEIPKLDNDALVEALGTMILIRRFEERSAELYKKGLIGGFCHLYTGEEAIAVGAKLACQEGDQLITGYRDHGHMITCGVEPKYILAELLGKRDGVSKGKGGSMHLFAPDKGFYGGHGIVGAQASLGTGLAFSNHYLHNGKACVTFFGDGAANQGQVYESFNMAALWKLPIVYVIENNQYAMGTHIDRATSQTNLSTRGDSFEISGISIDGMDLELIYSTIASALYWTRQVEEGPQIIEAETYRYSGHSMSDPAKYRTREEVSEVREHHDPIKILSAKLFERGALKESDVKEKEKEVRATLDDALRFALESEEADLSSLYQDVYHDAD